MHPRLERPAEQGQQGAKLLHAAFCDALVIQQVIILPAPLVIGGVPSPVCYLRL
ncbi:hypothetical protein M378DRAFT_812755 [Amanita muscaria Koide BX008]|uniref:Uncharacterized protein n=1 Tax=Amanita muscaria (strain Koide BX008) TaxID=946122 RepID=A0A0C2SFL4_AMAMK|nr:hypothetical protein M378DRAFT_812755 [Amanita muscaria Koide BX008]